uniref:Uncharacterized protein n=1 Tax=Ixodes ricinus TaxID=34613 RepID=A0A6B0U527_IXORI
MSVPNQAEGCRTFTFKSNVHHAVVMHDRTSVRCPSRSKRAGVGIEPRILGSAARAFAPRASSWCALAHLATYLGKPHS